MMRRQASTERTAVGAATEATARNLAAAELGALVAGRDLVRGRLPVGART